MRLPVLAAASLVAIAAIVAAPSARAEPPLYPERDVSGFPLLELRAEGGFERIDLAAFRVDPAIAAAVLPAGGNGGFVGASAAARFRFVDVGGHLRVGVTPVFQLLEFGPEVTGHMPFGAFEPRVSIGAGFASVGGLRDADGDDLSQLIGDMNGLYARASAGLDYRLHPAVSIGATASYEILKLSRNSVDGDTLTTLVTNGGLTQAQADTLGVVGSSVGSALAFSAALSVRF